MKLEVNLPDDLVPLLDKVASESDRFQTMDDFVNFAVTSLVLELFVHVFSEDDGGENETSECGLVGRENSRDLTRFLQEKEDERERCPICLKQLRDRMGVELPPL